MIDHDKDCRGCATAKRHVRDGGGFVYSDLARCERCGPTNDSSSYLHQVEGKSYCGTCAVVITTQTTFDVATGIITAKDGNVTLLPSGFTK